MESDKTVAWQSIWERNIIGESRKGYCNNTGEESGWLTSHLLYSFYYGYMATADIKWAQMLVACGDVWVGHAVTEPDGYLGWPKVGASGTPVDGLDGFYADSLLGEAMALRPIVLMSERILAEPRLKELFGAKAESFMRLSEKTFEKWDRRGAWRDTEGGGTMSVVLPFGIDQQTSKWTAGYDERNAPGNGFSHPNNKANLVAIWLLSMYDATREPIFKERAEKWFRLMKSRMTPRNDGTYQIWNYWQPAGPWDYKLFGLPKHWIGVHPNSGYYGIDVDGIVTAFEHGVEFNKDDINRLIATSLAEKRYWTALVPYSKTLQQNFEASNEPDSWLGASNTPWYLALRAGRLDAGRQAPPP